VELSLSLEEVKDLSKEFDVIPLFVEVLADTDTPLSLFLKLKNWGKYRALLESAEGGIKWGRFSFVALGSGLSFSFKDQEGDPFEAPKKFLEGLRAYRDPRLPRFWGGLVGYVAYDVVRFFEPVPIGKEDVIGLPDILLFLTELVLIHDNLSGKVKVVVPYLSKGGCGKGIPKGKETLQKALKRNL
jgi:anthranilate synthase component 1